jgi:hypothetical protein
MDVYSALSSVECLDVNLVGTMGESSVDLMVDAKVVCLV